MSQGTLSGTLSGGPEEPASPKGTLSGDLEEPAPAARGTLSGDLDEAVPGEGAVKGTLSGGDDAPAAPDHEPGAATLTRSLESFDFEVERELGRGGMGIVWLARQRSLGRPVAVKTLLAHHAGGPAAEKFAAEAVVTGRLEHPNIPPVHAYGQDPEGRPFLSMKLVKGVEWAKLLEPQSDPEKERAAKLGLRGHLEIIQRACEAIAFAHANGVIHRDLKPENVMVGEFGEVLVMDWGIALELASRRPPEPGAPRRPVGTPAYLAPEMAAADESRMGPWTDVYLLGGMLYELLTGTAPHRGESLMMVLLAAQKGEVESPRRRAPGREIPAMLAEIAMKALDPAPEKRHAGAQEFSAAIGEYLRNEASLKLSAAALAELSKVEEGIAAGGKGGGAADFYPRLQGCIAELKQAVKLWAGNRDATGGVVRAHLAYASYAIDRGDLGIAESELEAVPHDHIVAIDLRGRIDRHRAAKLAEARRRRRLFAVLGLALLVLAGLFVQQLKARIRRSRAVAEAEGASLLRPTDRAAVYWKALEIDDTWPEGQSELARAYIEKANEEYLKDPVAGTLDLGVAVAPFDRAIELDPEDVQKIADRGSLHEERGDYEKALDDYKRAIELDPESDGGQFSQAEVALFERRFADVEDIATARLDKQAAEDAYFQRAFARFAQGDAEGALEDALATQKYRPNDEWYVALTGLAMLGAGRERDAAEKLVIGCRIHPRIPHIAPLLAYIAARHGDMERARALVARARTEWEETKQCFLALEFSWRSASFAPAPLDALGKASVLEGDFEALAPTRPARPVELRRRGEERFRRGEVELGLADAERALADDPADGSARLLRAQCFIALGHLDGVESDLKVIDRLAPHRADDLAAAWRALEEKRAEAAPPAEGEGGGEGEGGEKGEGPEKAAPPESPGASEGTGGAEGPGKPEMPKDE